MSEFSSRYFIGESLLMEDSVNFWKSSIYLATSLLCECLQGYVCAQNWDFKLGGDTYVREGHEGTSLFV